MLMNNFGILLHKNKIIGNRKIIVEIRKKRDIIISGQMFFVKTSLAFYEHRKEC